METQKFSPLSTSTCRKLKEAGFPQNTLWSKFVNRQEALLALTKSTELGRKWMERYACPTFEEIWAELPKEFTNSSGWTCRLAMFDTALFYQYDSTGNGRYSFEYRQSLINQSITWAAAEMYLTLKSQGII